jgi:hypothetical protein
MQKLHSKRVEKIIANHVIRSYVEVGIFDLIEDFPERNINVAQDFSDAFNVHLFHSFRV